MLWVSRLSLVRTAEDLLPELLLGKPVNWFELGPGTPNWAFALILSWLLVYPFLDAITAKGSLAFLAL